VLPDLREHLLLGAAFTATVFLDTMTALWLLPIIAGLFLSPWLISLSSSESLGRRAAKAKFFRVPEPGIVEAQPSTGDLEPVRVDTPHLVKV
jgi:membrane glycosyltransferase